MLEWMIDLGPAWLTVILFGSLVVALAAGLPLVFALGGVSTLFVIFIWGPNALAVLSILVGIIVIGLLLAAFVGTSVNDFSKALPVYEKRLADITAAVVSWLKTCKRSGSMPICSSIFRTFSTRCCTQ